MNGGEMSEPGSAPRRRIQKLKAAVATSKTATPHVAKRETRPVARFRASQLERVSELKCDSAAGASTAAGLAR